MDKFLEDGASSLGCLPLPLIEGMVKAGLRDKLEGNCLMLNFMSFWLNLAFIGKSETQGKASRDFIF